MTGTKFGRLTMKSDVGNDFSRPDLNTNNGLRHEKCCFFSTDIFHISLDKDISRKASPQHFSLFGWSSRPGKCISIGTSWFAAGILFPLRSPSWTAKTDCKPASSTERSLHFYVFPSLIGWCRIRVIHSTPILADICQDDIQYLITAGWLQPWLFEFFD